ncbi:YcaO-like family protein [Kineococcus rhizosphaerae]|uniref:Ribosomal protein S12 methylthiotransferase accessory factor n=1 Tax=Kineococcus rhizosphaerae TaxID=559628 RepID=A0A2T0R295_9ACTN|nr:YcaO-like family protein [Kineococcus rhizosphaerae]PRY13900.1 ribosomal protein S12 methylthiotransferase accessory factor [Kineococcus rhizosphaerae]
MKTTHPLTVDHPVEEGDDHRATDAFRAALGERDRFQFPTYRLDTVGIPSWWTIAATGASGAAAIGHGYGATDADARRSSWGESAELALLRRTVATLEHRRGTRADLVAEFGADAVLDPPAVCLDAGAPYAPDAPLNWLPLQRWGTGERVWAPADVVLRDADELPPGLVDDLPRLVTRHGNGLGAGDSLERAVAHGIGELLQRDGNGTRFRALDTGVVLDLGPGDELVQDPVTREALAKLRAQGVRVVPKLANDWWGIVNVTVVGADENPLQPVMVTAAGEAAHPDREVALRKAVLEFAAARSRKAFTHGDLDAVRAISPEGYVDRYAADPATQEQRALRGMLGWLERDAAGLRALLEPVVLAERSRRRFDTLPTWSAPEGADEQQALCAHLVGLLRAEGFDVLVLDCSHDGVAVARVVVPGLEVEIVSYGRIGERGLADLLARGDGRTGLHAIVGLGTPGEAGVPATAVPVHLTDAARERVGGPAWLDRAALDRVLGELYPLYREPALHAAAVARENGWTA